MLGKELGLSLLFLGFVDSKGLTSFAVVGVLVRGFVSAGSAGGEMGHGRVRVLESGRCLITFPHYQCNESRFLRKGGFEWSEIRFIEDNSLGLYSELHMIKTNNRC